MNTVTLRANDTINLTTGVVTRSDQRSEIISFPTGLVAALRRNNLRALHLAIMDSVGQGERCHFCSQPAHGVTLCN